MTEQKDGVCAYSGREEGSDLKENHLLVRPHKLTSA